MFRDNITGKITCIRYHFSPNPEVYVQFRPSSFVGNNSEKSTADFVIFGFYAAKSVPVGLPIDRFFTLSFKEIFQITEKILPWNEQIFYPELYEDSIYMIGVMPGTSARRIGSRSIIARVSPPNRSTIRAAILGPTPLMIRLER